MKKLIIFLLLVVFVSGCSFSITAKKSNDLGIFKSVDSGETWAQYVYAGRTNKKELKIGDVSVRNIIANPDDQNILYICTINRGIYKSENGGDIWQETGLKQGTFVNVVFDAKDRNILYTASNTKILKSTNAGKNWSTIYIETQPEQKITKIVADHYDPSIIYATTNKGALLKSSNSGNTWQVLKWLNISIKNIYLDPLDSRIIYLVYGKGLMRSIDKGETWIDLHENLKSYKGANIISSISFNHNNPSEFYVTTDYGLLKTIDQGDNFKKVTTLVSFGNKIDQVVLDPARPNNIYLIKDNKFHISTNFGEDWKTILLPTSGFVTDMILIPKQESNTIYITIHKNS